VQGGKRVLTVGARKRLHFEARRLSKSENNLVIDPEFQRLLYPLSLDERALLEQSLLRDGCRDPLVAWREDGKLILLDGHNRFSICAKHDIKYEVEIVKIESREWARVWIRKNQLGRRNLKDDARGMVAARLLKDLTKLAIQEQRREAGKAGGRGRTKKDSESVTAADPLSKKGKKAKKDNRAVVAKQAGVSERKVRNASKLEDRAKELLGEKKGAEFADQIESGKLSMVKAKRMLGKTEAERKLRTAMALVRPTTDAPDVRHCTMQELLGKVRDADAVVTDPPYPEEYLPLYGELARLARQALKPGGILVVMVGHQHLDRVLADMCSHMPYRWIIDYETGDPCTQIFSRRVVNVAWKPILAFGDMGNSKWIHRDRVKSAAAEKTFHPWQQSITGMSKLIEYVTHPGDLVVDPFCGSGTTGVACARLGRRFVGCDVDKGSVEQARARVALAQAEAAAPLSGRIRLGSDGCGRRIGSFRCCTCVCGDAEKLMPQLPPSSIKGAVVTDPPYGVGAEAWDGKVPYHLLSRFLEVTDGPVLWFGAAPAIGAAHASFDPLPERMLIWAPSFTNSHSMSNGLQYRWHAIYSWRLPPKHDGPTWDLLTTPTESGNWWTHTCTKPLALMEQLCRFVPEGGVVLDPFAGSGSTLVAARNCGQHFLGFEKDPAHCDVAVKRLLERSAMMMPTRDREEAA
jgi:DNA modification methylase